MIRIYEGKKLLQKNYRFICSNERMRYLFSRYKTHINVVEFLMIRMCNCVGDHTRTYFMRFIKPFPWIAFVYAHLIHNKLPLYIQTHCYGLLIIVSFRTVIKIEMGRFALLCFFLALNGTTKWSGTAAEFILTWYILQHFHN